MESVTDLNKRRGPVNAGSRPDPDENSKMVDEEADGQKRLEGMERVIDSQIEEQAAKVKALETKRKRILEKEVAEREILTKLMRDKKITVYNLSDDYEGYVVEVETEPKAKIHKAKKKDEDEE